MRLLDYIIIAAMLLLQTVSTPSDLWAMDSAAQPTAQMDRAGHDANGLFASSATGARREVSSRLLSRGSAPPPRIEPVILGDIFERKGGHVHAFLTASNIYIDNIYKTRDNPVKDTLTKLSAGLWLAMPGIKQPIKDERISTASLGGRQDSLLRQFSDNRYQVYLMYSMDQESYAENAFYNGTYHNADAVFQLNFRGGLSMGIWDTFARGHDEDSAAIANVLDQFDGNRLNAVISYAATDKLTMRVAHTSFTVDYLAAANDYRDRTDSVVSAYLIYRFMPKTSFFLEYEAASIDYGLSNQVDSTETRYGGGFKWDISKKSMGSIRAGYSLREYDDPAMTALDDAFYAMQMTHEMTGKSSARLIVEKGRRESTVIGYDYINSTSAKLILWNKMTEKLTGFIGIDYLASDYMASAPATSREDTKTGLWTTFEFAPLKWLSSEIGYKTETNSSSLDLKGYTANTTFIKINASF